jgi:hypothetical protein
MKVVYSMAQILALDPCRTAVFGLTMEDIFLRLWYFDRSGTIVSRAIDIFEVPHRSIVTFTPTLKVEIG